MRGSGPSGPRFCCCSRRAVAGKSGGGRANSGVVRAFLFCLSVSLPCLGASLGSASKKQPSKNPVSDHARLRRSDEHARRCAAACLLEGRDLLHRSG